MSYYRQTVINPIEYLNNQITSNSILAKNLTITRTNKGQIKGQIEGDEDMCLPDTYYRTLTKELTQLYEQYLIRLYSIVRGECTITIKANNDGSLDWEEIHLKVNCECSIGISPLDYFNKPLSIILPFSKAIKTVTFFGRKSKISYLIAEIFMTSSYFASVLDSPKVDQQQKADWHAHCKEIWERASKEHQYDLVVPCHEGYLSLDSKMSVLYFCVKGEQKSRLS